MTRKDCEAYLGRMLIMGDINESQNNRPYHLDFCRVAMRDFPELGDVWCAMAEVAARKDRIDVVNLCAQLSKAGKLADVGGPAAIAGLTDAVCAGWRPAPSVDDDKVLAAQLTNIAQGLIDLGEEILNLSVRVLSRHR